MKKCMIFALAATTLFACKKETEPGTPQPESKYGSGVLITNEGVFNTGSGTVSFYNRDNKSIENEIFQEANGIPVGNILQSAAQFGNAVYLVVNNSQQILVANAGGLKQEAVITGFQSPRFMKVVSGDKAYVTDWVSNSVRIVNVKTNSISGSIPTGIGPENMAQIGTKLFVANSGGFGADSTITVINTLTDQVEGSFVVGPNPSSIQVDVNGNIWVLCAGVSDWQDPTKDVGGKLVQVDRTTFTIMKSIDFPNNTDHPAKLSLNEAGTVLYYLSSGYGGDVFKMSISETMLPQSAFISGTFYGIGVDPLNDDVYTSDPLDYNQRGIVYRYSSNAQMIDSVRAGVIPGYFLFR